MRYELVRSFHRGNGLLGIYVHNVRNLDKQTTVAGPNPFEQLAFRVVDGRISWLEVSNGNWTVYDRVPTMAQSDAAYDLGGRTNHTFGNVFRAYDWVNDNGYANLGTWLRLLQRKLGNDEANMAQITKEQLLRDFSKAIGNDEAALFIGAGLSVGAGFVDWRGLLRDIAKDLKLNVDEEHNLVLGCNTNTTGTTIAAV